jgi:hypothetical protein
MPIRRLNSSECELVEPQLPKPISRRICRRNCIEWRIGNWAEVKILIKADTNIPGLESVTADIVQLEMGKVVPVPPEPGPNFFFGPGP